MYLTDIIFITIRKRKVAAVNMILRPFGRHEDGFRQNSKTFNTLRGIATVRLINVVISEVLFYKYDN